MKRLSALLMSIAVLALAGCSSQPKQPYDYTAFKESKPKSILVVMPTNSSPDAKAPTSVLSRATLPLVELGYYVYPVALVDETFKQNGLTDGEAIQGASINKIQSIFGADAIMYMDVEEYGSSYQVFDSVTTVTVKAKLVDLRSGKTLWEGRNKATSGSVGQNSNALGALIVAAVSQIANTVQDRGYEVAGAVVPKLFYSGNNGGVLYGPYHPNYNKEEK